jgi:hypothetical protein
MTSGVKRTSSGTGIKSIGMREELKEKKRGFILSSSLWTRQIGTARLEADAKDDRDEAGFCAVLGEDVEAVSVCVA